jgi:hypothetical protein
MILFKTTAVKTSNPTYAIDQCCPTFLYIGAHLNNGCGGAGAVGRLQQQQIIIIIK